MKLSFRVVLLTILFQAWAVGAEDNHHKNHKAKVGVEVLSPDLRNLLSQEMKALEGGMMSVIPAYISGNWAEIEKIAGKMKNSYILKQSLTETQVKELHSVLPKGFIEKDQRFHYLAGMLEHAAKSKKPELINFYFSEMNTSCIDCHSAFAAHKFPNLKSDEEAKHTEHTH